MFSFLAGKKKDPKELLKEVLGEDSLPTFPAIAAEVLRTIRRPNVSIKEVGKILALDPGLSVQILKMANAAAFMPVRKIANLDQAIAFVGMGHIQALVMCSAIRKAVPKMHLKNITNSHFWLVSARRGIIAQGLAQSLCPIRQSECFTAGFLQDLAIPFFAHSKPVEYQRIWTQLETDKSASLPELERKLFGCDHAEAATWLCSEWDLPEGLASSIGGHHGSAGGAYDSPAPVQLAALLGYYPDESEEEQIVERAVSEHDLSRQHVEKILSTSAEQAQEFGRLFE